MTRGPEHYVLSLALLAPLVIAMLLVSQLPGSPLTVSFQAPSDAAPNLVTRRPAASAPTPPPTLAAARPTPRPTATPPPAAPTATVMPTSTTERTYTVQPGDELKNIAAAYGVSIWKIIDSNDIPNPDSLRVGQVLRIPDG